MNDEVNKLKQGIAKQLNELINPNKNTIKKPHNRLWIALVAFNVIFLPLDDATGFTVGYVTRGYYGLFVFGAGFGTMVIHEALYSNPFAKWWQKGISIAGFLTSILVTSVIGVAAIVINILATGYNKELYGAVMAGISFLVLFFHGLLIAAYYFTDSGIIAKQKTASTYASHEELLQNVSYSEQLVDRINDLEKKINIRIESGDGERLGAVLGSITGDDWISATEKKVISRPPNP
jgi:hypothetical protein